MQERNPDPRELAPTHRFPRQEQNYSEMLHKLLPSADYGESSNKGRELSENLFAYAATKAAILNPAKGLSQLAADRGIRVVAVAAGSVWTPRIPSMLPQEKVEKLFSNITLGRLARPVDLTPF